MISTLPTPRSASIVATRAFGIISAVSFGSGNAACHGLSDDDDAAIFDSGESRQRSLVPCKVREMCVL